MAPVEEAGHPELAHVAVQHRRGPGLCVSVLDRLVGVGGGGYGDGRGARIKRSKARSIDRWIDRSHARQQACVRWDVRRHRWFLELCFFF